MNTNANGVSSAGKRRSGFLFAAALAVTFALAFGTAQAMAAEAKGGHYGATGGFSGPGPGIVTVEQARSMGDDAKVALKGYIVQNIGGKDYLFKDETGTINVEISDRRWQGQQVGPEDLVEIHGEVDKEWNSVEIEVKRIIKL